MQIPKKVEKFLEKWLTTKGPKTHTASEQLDCDICNDPQWFLDHGYSEAERHFLCGPAGINCPGFGGDPQN